MNYIQWLEASRFFTVPGNVYVFGAGFGTSDTIKWLSDNEITNVTLIESYKPNYLNLLKKLETKHPSWKFHNLCAENGTECDVFHSLSVNYENGLTSIDHLKDLWKNIELLETYKVSPVPFKDFFKDQNESSGIWVMINYFCSVKALSNIPKSTMLLSVRINKSVVMPSGFSETEWSDKLKENGYKILIKNRDTHPKIENWLCVKDAELMLSNMTDMCRQKDEQLKEMAELLRKKEKAIELANNEIKELNSEAKKDRVKLKELADSEINRSIVNLKESQQKANELILELKELGAISKLCFENIDMNMNKGFIMQEKFIKILVVQKKP